MTETEVAISSSNTSSTKQAEFSIQVGVLLQALKKISGIIDSAQVIEILSFVKIQLDGQVMTLTTSNSEIELVCHANLEAAVAEPSQLTLPCRKLADIAKTLPQDGVLTCVYGKDWAQISAGRSRFKLACLPADGFPTFSQDEKAQSWEILEQDLYFLLSRSAFAMANQDVRFFLNGMLLDLASDRLNAVATDGHRLAFNSLGMSLPLDKQAVIIPRKTVAELTKLLQQEAAVLNVRVNSQQIHFQCERFALTSNLIEGDFPPYQRFIPVGYTLEAVIDVAKLKVCLNRAIILANQKFYGVKLTFQSGSLVIDSSNVTQEQVEDQIDIEYEGETLSIGFNIQYLMDVLQTVSSAQVRFCMVDAAQKVLIEEFGTENNSQFVVMPLTL